MLEPAIRLNVTVERWTDLLLEQGYCVIPELLPRESIAALDDDLEADFAETPFCRGGFYGARTKRFGRLLVRSPVARNIVQHELILGIAGRDMIMLALVFTLSIVSFGTGRTNVLTGFVHIVVFLAYLMLLIIP